MAIVLVTLSVEVKDNVSLQQINDIGRDIVEAADFALTGEMKLDGAKRVNAVTEIKIVQ